MNQITSQIAVRFGKSRKVKAVAGLREASEIWCAFRDINGLGASESPSVTVVDTASGATVARISYNGRAWDSAGKEIAL